MEITIKDLENMLHVEVSKLWSKGLIEVHTNSRASYDPQSNSVVKLGKHLKEGDLITRKVDADGKVSHGSHAWRVVELRYTESLSADDLVL